MRSQGQARDRSHAQPRADRGPSPRSSTASMARNRACPRRARWHSLLRRSLRPSRFLPSCLPVVLRYPHPAAVTFTGNQYMGTGPRRGCAPSALRAPQRPVEGLRTPCRPSLPLAGRSTRARQNPRRRPQESRVGAEALSAKWDLHPCDFDGCKRPCAPPWRHGCGGAGRTRRVDKGALHEVSGVGA